MLSVIAGSAYHSQEETLSKDKNDTAALWFVPLSPPFPSSAGDGLEASGLILSVTVQRRQLQRVAHFLSVLPPGRAPTIAPCVAVPEASPGLLGFIAQTVHFVQSLVHSLWLHRLAV